MFPYVALIKLNEESINCTDMERIREGVSMRDAERIQEIGSTNAMRNPRFPVLRLGNFILRRYRPTYQTARSSIKRREGVTSETEMRLVLCVLMLQRRLTCQSISKSQHIQETGEILAPCFCHLQWGRALSSFTKAVNIINNSWMCRLDAHLK